MLLKMGKHIYIFVTCQYPQGLSGTQCSITTGANWDTPGLTGTVSGSPTRIVHPVSPGLISHKNMTWHLGTTN